MKILIAEDDDITRRRLQHFLEKWQHQVIAAENGLDALEHFLSKDIDIVITDWMMPEMDGLELVSHIRSRVREKPYVYTILLTSRGDKEDVVLHTNFVKPCRVKNRAFDLRHTVGLFDKFLP